MATTITKSFSDFAENFKISNRQENLVATRRKNVVAALASQLSLYSKSPSLLIGSYDRKTMTRYLTEGDVDVMVVLDYGAHKSWDNSQGTIDVLDKFKTILDKAYSDTKKRRDRNCISMEFSEFTLDVVPAFAFNSGFYKIPDTIRKEWLYTDPIKFAERSTEINTTMDGMYIPLVKMVKAWNRHVGKPLHSFHLECIMQTYYASYTKGYSYSSMLKVFFGSLPSNLRLACYDPIKGDRVDTYLDNGAQKSDRTIAIEKA